MGPQLAWRVIAGKVGLGNGLIVGLLRGCLDKGCRIVTDADVKHLLMEEGSVAGVEAVIDGKIATIRARKGVVLATGGFDWAPDYMPRHFPGIDLIGAPRTNTGDGQRMAAEAGALLERMDQANIAPATFTTYEGRRHAQPLYESYGPHCILVNRDGVRFVSEGSPALGSALDERDVSRQAEASAGLAHLRPALQEHSFDALRIEGSGLHPQRADARGIGGKDRPQTPRRCARRSSVSTAGPGKASTATSIAASWRGNATTPEIGRSAPSSRRRSSLHRSFM